MRHIVVFLNGAEDFNQVEGFSNRLGEITTIVDDSLPWLLTFQKAFVLVTSASREHFGFPPTKQLADKSPHGAQIGVIIWKFKNSGR